jgi:hypothetical protein
MEQIKDKNGAGRFSLKAYEQADHCFRGGLIIKG